ncbi:hypothetical protein CK203_012101 [Vitis vinifera]|uniref:Uncharacterized protein n=1 Tax=Vitis vinifera TaxID=29760 RepID=A0A438K0B2_VITVI|nr:hypothetical protein CK203_012101 [Vitis vinifera]
MEQTESDIKRVLQDYQKIGSGARCEEARIEVLNREIKVLEDRVRGSGSVELERHRMRNLLDYQSTLIARAASRTELLAALHEDLLLLFIRRKQLRGFGMGLLKSVWLLKNIVNSEEKKRNGKAVYFLNIMSWVRKSEQFKHSTELSQDSCIRRLVCRTIMAISHLAPLPCAKFMQCGGALPILFNVSLMGLSTDGAEGSGVDAAPNVSLSSALSGGDDENQRFAKNCSELRSMHIMRMSHHEDLEEETTADQQPIPLGVKLLQINMNEDASLTSEDGCEYGDLQYKNNILDNIAMSILDPNANIDNIFKEAVENSNILCVESEGSKKAHRKSSRAKRLFVDFDETGNPTGPSAGVFKRSINSYVCQLLPIRFKQIGEIPVEDYKSVVNALTVKKDLERGIEPQKPSYVDEEDWNAFVAKTKDEEFDRISKKNKASRSQQSALNRKDVQSTAHKRKVKGDQGPEGISIWSKLHKPKQGMAKWAAWSGNLFIRVEISDYFLEADAVGVFNRTTIHDSMDTMVLPINDAVMDTMVLPINEEVVQEQDLESELPLKDYPQLDTPRMQLKHLAFSSLLNQRFDPGYCFVVMSSHSLSHDFHGLRCC